MSKFKVGDKVTVHEDSDGDKEGISEDVLFEAVIETADGVSYAVRSQNSVWWVGEDMLTEIKSGPVVSIWTDHLGHISRALDSLNKAMRDMNEPYGDSDLKFTLEGQIRANIYGEPTNWVLAYDPDSEVYTFQIREPE